MYANNAHLAMHADSGELNKLKTTLIKTVSDFLNRRLPLRRIVFVASILKNCNIKLPTADTITNQLLSEQHKDGGWIDCEDTAWALYYIDENSLEKKRDKGMGWLERERNVKKGWGFCKRDNPCIPITAQILHLLPAINSYKEAANWIEKEWKKDIESSIKLNYKAAWYILAYVSLFEKTQLSEEIFYTTMIYLIDEQRSDGSWGPWRNHPATSDCYSTGICMTALALSYRITENNKVCKALGKSLQWVKKNQLKNGLFPTHYIEEGSAWIYWGWSKAATIVDI